LTQLAETTKLTDDLIHENTLESFHRADKYYNRKAQYREFQPGQRVLLYDEHVPAGVMRKLNRFYRLVEVAERLQHECYRLKDVKTQRILPFKIHVTRLKALTSKENAIQTANTSGDKVAPPTQVVAQPQQQQQRRQQRPPPTRPWHAISGILRRKRTPTGAYLYLVRWLADGSTNWLPARDIAPQVVRLYNASLRRRRRH